MDNWSNTQTFTRGDKEKLIVNYLLTSSIQKCEIFPWKMWKTALKFLLTWYRLKLKLESISFFGGSIVDFPRTRACITAAGNVCLHNILLRYWRIWKVKAWKDSIDPFWYHVPHTFGNQMHNYIIAMFLKTWTSIEQESHFTPGEI